MRRSRWSRAGAPLTRLNVRTLARHFNGADVASNRIENTSHRHLRRCLDAGLVAITDDGATLTLTAEGRAAIAEEARR